VVETSEPIPYAEGYANGNKKMTGFHLDGEMHGAWVWYRTDGSLMRTGQFDRGRQIGIWRTFERSGHLVKETNFTRP
jgi:antitoxin component YwqK of YwqJK toxin-antitoxin module